MQIGVNCFKDVHICSMITSNERIGKCEITGVNDIPVYDTNIDTDLESYLSEILDIYTPMTSLPDNFPNESLNNIENILFENWSLFNTSEPQIKTIIMEICKEVYACDAPIFNEKVGMEKICDIEYLIQNSLVKEYSWESFIRSIKNINRFHSMHINLDLLEKLFNKEGLQMVIPKENFFLIRARICDENGLTKEQMGPPLEKNASAGRANSAGISCLYLANDMITALHEIRARDLDFVSVATFAPIKELKIVDLSNLDIISPFSAGDLSLEWFAINMTILKKISHEIAKPLRRHDSELDYLPAQYISDYIKSLGYHGICYRSTLNSEGLNYAFFEHQNLKCIDVKLYHVNSLEYNTEPIL